MRAVKAQFDGERIILPANVSGLPPGEVIVVFGEGKTGAGETHAWMKVQEGRFAEIWDNDEDAIYDSL